MDHSEYQKVVQANIDLHTRLSSDYNTCEPHFRPENVSRVEQRIQEIVQKTRAVKHLDMGCGTGFMINITRKYVDHIVGLDVTQAMLDKVDKSGPAKIELHNHDTGTFPVAENSFDIVTGYSFLHHLYDVLPTLRTACRALKPGGILYADLDPNYYFWESVHTLKRDGVYDPIVKREVEMVTYKDEDIEKNFGVDKNTFNYAEYGKNIKGGFKEEDITDLLKKVGFSRVEFFYHWFLGQGQMINDKAQSKEENIKRADIVSDALQRCFPISRNLFKYVGFYAIK
jgi:ubiquinone/menaquinone biosynthesis C-methylase UbiE